MPSRLDAPLAIAAVLAWLTVIIQTAPRTPEPPAIVSCELKGSV